MSALEARLAKIDSPQSLPGAGAGTYGQIAGEME